MIQGDARRWLGVLGGRLLSLVFRPPQQEELRGLGRVVGTVSAAHAGHCGLARLWRKATNLSLANTTSGPSVILHVLLLCVVAAAPHCGLHGQLG